MNRSKALMQGARVSLLCSMMTTDTGGPGPEFGAGSSFTDLFDNVITSAQSAFSQYNATANTPAPANTISEALVRDIQKPAVLVVGALLLFWWLR